MKIDTDKYMTIEDAAKAIGAAGRRSIYRVISRAEADGEVVSERIFGRRVIHKSSVETLKAYYFPFGSEQRSEIAKLYGSLGGQAKRDNMLKKRRKS